MPTLSTDQQKILTALVNLIAKTENKSIRPEVIPNCLNGHSLKNIVLFANNSATVADFYKTNAAMKRYWLKRLSEETNFQSALVTMKGDVLTPYDLLEALGTYDLTATENLPQGLSLYAFAKRTLHQREKLLTLIALPEDERTETIDKEIDALNNSLADDTDNMAQHYWALGALRAGAAWFDLADSYAENPSFKLQLERFEVSGKPEMYPKEVKTLLIQACQYFYMTKLLQDVPISKNIVAGFYPEEGIFAETKSHFTNFDTEFEAYLDKRLKSFSCPESLRDQIKSEALKNASDVVKEAVVASAAIKLPQTPRTTPEPGL